MKVKENIGKIISVGVGIVAVAGIGLYNFFSNKETPMYSRDWFESLSDIDLQTEREKIRRDYVNAGDFELGVKLENILMLFDKEMERRECAGETPSDYIPPKHGEHGWYLSSDD